MFKTKCLIFQWHFYQKSAQKLNLLRNVASILQNVYAFVHHENIPDQKSLFDSSDYIELHVIIKV